MSKFDNTFNNFAYEGKVGDRTLVRELIFVQSAFLE